MRKMVSANAAGCWAPSSTSIKLDKLEPERLKRPPGAAAGINKALGREKQKYGRFRDKIRKRMAFFFEEEEEGIAFLHATMSWRQNHLEA